MIILKSILWQNMKKLDAEKKPKGDPLVPLDFVCYAEKNFYSSVPWAKWSNLTP